MSELNKPVYEAVLNLLNNVPVEGPDNLLPKIRWNIELWTLMSKLYDDTDMNREQKTAEMFRRLEEFTIEYEKRKPETGWCARQHHGVVDFVSPDWRVLVQVFPNDSGSYELTSSFYPSGGESTGKRIETEVSGAVSAVLELMHKYPLSANTLA